jgi:hypothetical protein
VLVGLSVVAYCNDRDSDEQQAGAPKPAASQTTAPKPSQKAGEDEKGEEGPATPAAVAQEKPKETSSVGHRFLENRAGRAVPAIRRPPRSGEVVVYL